MPTISSADDTAVKTAVKTANLSTFKAAIYATINSAFVFPDEATNKSTVSSSIISTLETTDESTLNTAYETTNNSAYETALYKAFIAAHDVP